MKFVKIAGLHCSKVHNAINPTENVTTNLIRVLTKKNPTDFECSIMNSIADNVSYTTTIEGVVVTIPSIRIIPVERANAAGIEYAELNDDDQKVIDSVLECVKIKMNEYTNIKNQLDKIQSDIIRFIDVCDDKGYDDLVNQLKSWLEEQIYSWTLSWDDSY